MNHIRIVTDTASDITRQEAKVKGIDLVALRIVFGDQDFIQEEADNFRSFYERLESDKEFPKTSRPTPSQYLSVYRDAEEKGQDVIVISVSSGLSGTYESALVAKKMTDYQDHIHVIDSQQAILGQRLLVDYAVSLRQQGAATESIVEKIESLKERVKIFGVIDTLKYLKKGGRIPASLAFIGQTLQLKPIIELKQGQLGQLDKKRGLKSARKAMKAQLTKHSIDPAFPILFGYTYQADNAKKFMEDMMEYYPQTQLDLYPVGGIIGSHVGPKAYAACFVEAADQ